MNDLRIGHGYDVHKLVETIPFIICGIKIDFSKGSLGHSDGDVGLHAICDAILGALGLGDLGTHFSSLDPKWKGADSSHFLNHVLRLMTGEGYSINNIDCTIILQSPHINQHIQDMRKQLNNYFHDLDISQISVKATTTDKLGSIGRGEGVAASAIVLLKKDSHER